MPQRPCIVTYARPRGVWGWVDDGLAFVRGLGFDVREIRVPVTIRYGAADVLVPAAHGAWLAEHVPGATVVICEAGRLTDPDARLAQLPDLVADTRTHGTPAQ